VGILLWKIINGGNAARAMLLVKHSVPAAPTHSKLKPPLALSLEHEPAREHASMSLHRPVPCETQTRSLVSM